MVHLPSEAPTLAKIARFSFKFRLPKVIDSWNFQIREFVKYNHFERSIFFFKELLHSNTELDAYNFCLLLKSYSALVSYNPFRCVHGFLIKNGFRNHTEITVSLVFVYKKFGEIKYAQQIFDELPMRDSCAYNSLICEETNNGNLQEAFEAFACMKQLGVSPSSESLACIIRACGELRSVHNWLYIQDYLCKNNHFLSNIIVGNSLISMYVRFGRLDLACYVFDNMPNRDIVSWNSVIVACARHGHWTRAFDFYKWMRDEKFVANRITFLGLLHACGQAKNSRLGMSIHSSLYCLGLISDTKLGTCVMDMYSKCGQMDFAFHIFEEKSFQRSLVSWNSLIAGYTQNGYHVEAVNLFLQLLSDPSVKLDSITLTNVISAFVNISYLSNIQSIHGLIIKNNFDVSKDVVLATAMVDAYGKCFDIESASLFINSIEKPNVATWNAMMLGYNLNGQPWCSINLFIKMLRCDIYPDSITLVSLLQSCGELESLANGMSVHGVCILYGFDCFTIIGNALIDMYISCRDFRSSKFLFDLMTIKNVITWNTMLSGLVKLGHANTTLNLFKRMLEESLQVPDSITLLSFIQACSDSIFSVPMAHGYVLKVGFILDAPILNSIMDAYARNGSIDASLSLFDQRDVLRDQSSWNIIISGLGMNGKGEDALSYLSKMEENGYKPNSITFVSLLSSCSHCGLVEKGCEYFDLMVKKYKISPSVEHLTCIVDMFARVGRLEEAWNMIESTLSGSKSEVVWGSLLSASHKSGNMKIGEIAGRQVLELAPDNCGYYTLLSNVYKSFGKWNEAERMRSVFEYRKLVKKAGASMILAST